MTKWARILFYGKQTLTYVAPLLFIFFAASFLRKASDQTSRDEVFRLIKGFSFTSISLSGLATLGSFFLLSCSEILGFRSSGTLLSWRRISKVSLISFGVSNTLSLGGIASTSLRFRLYLKDKIAPAAILKVTAFSSAGVWIGFFVLLGLCIFIQPIPLPPEFHIETWHMRAIASVSLFSVAVYLTLAYAQKPVIHLFGQKLSFPRAPYAFGQTAIAMVDWTVAAMALYVLLPPIEGVDFARFLHVFLIAQIIGAVTTIPGGLGILEILTVYLLLPNREVTPDVAAALVLYRFIYYVIPLIVALVILAVEEVVEGTNLAAVVMRGLLRLSSNWVPLLGAGATVAVGLSFLTESSSFALFSSRTLAAESAFSVSALAMSIYGMLIVVLADGVRRRSFSAWALTVLTIGVTTVLLVMVHAPFFTIAFAISMAAILVFCRNEFFRRSRLFDEILTKEWTFFVALGCAAVGWLAFALARDISLGAHPWWDFSLDSDNWSLQASVPLVTAVTGLSLWRLVSPNGKASRRMPYLSCSVAQAAPMALASPVTQSQLVLLGDKEIFTDKEREGFIMYAIEGKTWVALGDPVSGDEKQKQLIEDFYTFVDKHGGFPVFYQVQPTRLSQYVDHGYQLLKVGEEARVLLPEFTLEGRDRKSMRNTCNRMESEKVTFEILNREQVTEEWARLEEISNAWLKAGKMKEKGFSLGYFDRDYLSHFNFAVLRQEGKIVAFANLWETPDRSELSIDLMRSDSEAPSGAMEFMFIKIMLWGKAEGYNWFNLGMAPLSGLPQGRVASRTWNQLGSMIYDAGEAFYNFKGVRAFKDKFDPVWEPRYLAYPSAFALPAVLTDLARLISRGSSKGRDR